MANCVIGSRSSRRHWAAAAPSRAIPSPCRAITANASARCSAHAASAASSTADLSCRRALLPMLAPRGELGAKFLALIVERPFPLLAERPQRVPDRFGDGQVSEPLRIGGYDETGGQAGGGGR